MSCQVVFVGEIDRDFSSSSSVSLLCQSLRSFCHQRTATENELPTKPTPDKGLSSPYVSWQRFWGLVWLRVYVSLSLTSSCLYSSDDSFDEQFSFRFNRRMFCLLFGHKGSLGDEKLSQEKVIQVQAQVKQENSVLHVVSLQHRSQETTNTQHTLTAKCKERFRWRMTWRVREREEGTFQFGLITPDTVWAIASCRSVCVLRISLIFLREKHNNILSDMSWEES